MQWLAEICVKRPVFATMLVMSLVVVGLFSFVSLGVDLFPKIDFPMSVTAYGKYFDKFEICPSGWKLTSVICVFMRSSIVPSKSVSIVNVSRLNSAVMPALE